jgi:CheY-like chemotaxis protein
LVVDDDPTNLEVLRVRLSAQGYEVVIAVDGDDALRCARELVRSHRDCLHRCTIIRLS